MDEKGFLLGDLKKMKRVFTKCYQDSGKLRGAGQDYMRKALLVLAARTFSFHQFDITP